MYHSAEDPKEEYTVDLRKKTPSSGSPRSPIALPQKKADIRRNPFRGRFRVAHLRKSAVRVGRYALKQGAMTVLVGSLVFGGFFELAFLPAPKVAEAAYEGRQLRTAEFVLGGGASGASTYGTDQTTRASGNLVYAGSAFNTTKGTAGTKTINLLGTNVEVRNAYLEARVVITSSVNGTNLNHVIDVKQGQAGGVDTYVHPLVRAGTPFTTTGLSRNVYTRSDVTAQFSGIVDAQWTTGVQVVAGTQVSGPAWAGLTMKLIITYEVDRTVAAQTNVKTVRFPLDSTNGSDTGSRTASCAVNSTCSFTYTAELPDLNTSADIVDVFFELRGQSTSTQVATMTPKISTGAGNASFNEVEALNDDRDLFIIYRPPASEFASGTQQTLDIMTGSAALFALGGELVVTYKFSTGAATQAETVSYFMKQETTGMSNASQFMRRDIRIANASVSAKNLWYRAITAPSASLTVSVAGAVGSGATTTQAYVLSTASNPRAGEVVIIHDLSAQAASFTSGTTTLTASTTNSSGTGDSAINLELFVTFTWDASQGGPETKTVKFFGGTSGGVPGTGTERMTFPASIILPETVTKYYRSAYIRTSHHHSETGGTTIALGTVTMTVNGTSTATVAELDDTEAFNATYLQEIPNYLFVGTTTAPELITFEERKFLVGWTNSAADDYFFSSEVVVTYEVNFTENAPTENGRQLRTAEFVLGGGASGASTYGTDQTARASTNLVYAGSAFNTTKGTAGTKTISLLGTNVVVRNAYLEARFVVTAATAGTEFDHVIDVKQGQAGGVDTYVHPLVRAGTPFQSTGLTQNVYTRSDVTAQFSGIVDAQWTTGVQVVAGTQVTGPAWAGLTMKLIITYEVDRTVAAQTNVKTVRFPLDSTNGSDTGSRTAACTALATCGFTYTAELPDLNTSADIVDVFFELRGQSTSSLVATITPKISTGAGNASFNEVEALADERDFFIIYRPPASEFASGTQQTLNILNGQASLHALGGELVVTYKFSTGAATQAETVSYFMKQETTGMSNASQFMRRDIRIANASVSAKNLWYRAITAPSGSLTVNVDGAVGSGATTSQGYVLAGGTNPRTGEVVIIHDLSAQAASFTSGTTTLTASTTNSSGTGDSAISLELFVTFTWDASQGGPETKTVKFFGGTSGGVPGTATERMTFPASIILPETVTKYYRSAYMRTSQNHSENGATIALGTVTMTVNGTSTATVAELDDTEAFNATYLQEIPNYLFVGTTTAPELITFEERKFLVGRTNSAADDYFFSSEVVVTYEAGFVPPAEATVSHFRFRSDNGSEAAAASLAAEDTDVHFLSGVLRIRFLVERTAGSPSYAYRLEYSSGPCSSWTTVPVSPTTEHWQMTSSAFVSDGTATADNANLTNPGGKTFTAGQVKTTGNQTSAISLSTTQFTEIEYAITPTANAALFSNYCLRVTNAGDASEMVYAKTPRVRYSYPAILGGAASGGGGSESSATPGSQKQGGGQGSGEAEPTIVSNGLVLRFSFDDITLSQVTGEVRDKSATGLHGDWINHASSSVTGKIGNGLTLDGTNDEVRIADNAAIDFTYNQDFAISLWLKVPVSQVTTADLDNMIIEKFANNGEAYPYALRHFNQTAGAWDNRSIEFSRYDLTNYPKASTTMAMNDDQWHHIVAMKNGAILSLFVDGVLNSTTTDTTTAVTTNNIPISLGARQAPSALGWFSGTYDEFRIYNRYLTQDEITQLYQMGVQQQQGGGQGGGGGDSG